MCILYIYNHRERSDSSFSMYITIKLIFINFLYIKIRTDFKYSKTIYKLLNSLLIEYHDNVIYIYNICNI